VSLALWCYRQGLRSALALAGAAFWIARKAGPAKRGTDDPAGVDILLTATFYSENWLVNHLRPLAGSSRCRRVRIVVTSPFPAIPKVEAIHPPAWLQRLAGAVPARLCMFCWVGLRDRPHVVGGFHLLINGLAALLVGACTGARTLYFCGGGPLEVLGGGNLTENRIFGRIGPADTVIERQLLSAVSRFDAVIVMGGRAREFFRGRGVRAPLYVVPGGLDPALARAPGEEKAYDLILVGRFTQVKRVDLFLTVVARVKESLPRVRAVVVGDGPLMRELRGQADSLALGGAVEFAGHQSDVGPWLHRSRIFVLTSDSEGLSLALMEAMRCGLPAVVPDVGDLGDLVRDGVNGFLVEGRAPEAFAERLIRLLADEKLRDAFSQRARETAAELDTDVVSRRWDVILGFPPARHPAAPAADLPSRVVA
jgi:glycosyltransferase involved in cell wall biosynthesis